MARLSLVQAVTRPPLGLPQPLRFHGQRCAWFGLLAGRRGLQGAADLAVMTVEHGLQGIRAVAQPVPAIGPLNRVGRTLADAVGVGPGTVARDDLDGGMLPEPGGEGVGLPVGQQVKGAFAFQVDDDGAVALPAAKRPVVDPDHARRLRRLSVHAPHQTQQGIRAHRNREALGQPGARFTADEHAEIPLQVAQPGGAPGLRQGDRRQAFGEDPARAGIVPAAKAANPKANGHASPLPGQIGQVTVIGAVPVPGRPLAGGAIGRRGGRVGLQEEVVFIGKEAINQEASR
jgi:hypothetical protein